MGPRILLVGGVALVGLGLGCGASAAEKDASSAQVVVKVWDRIPLSRPLWARAAAVVEEVFEDAGVRVDWKICGPDAEPDCSCPMAPREIGLRLHRRSPAEAAGTHPATGGATLVTDRASARGIAYVFYDRLERVARDEKLRPELVLALTVAHELGHVLLPPGHSTSGIMQARLAAREWSQAQRGWARFATEDAQRMRERLSPAF